MCVILFFSNLMTETILCSAFIYANKRVFIFRNSSSTTTKLAYFCNSKTLFFLILNEDDTSQILFYLPILKDFLTMSAVQTALFFMSILVRKLHIKYTKDCRNKLFRERIMSNNKIVMDQIWGKSTSCCASSLFCQCNSVP